MLSAKTQEDSNRFFAVVFRVWTIWNIWALFIEIWLRVMYSVRMCVLKLIQLCVSVRSFYAVTCFFTFVTYYVQWCNQ